MLGIMNGLGSCIYGTVGTPVCPKNLDPTPAWQPRRKLIDVTFLFGFDWLKKAKVNLFLTLLFL